ncbi:YolD-like protein [Alicyclobacillus hesperidum URH17-3-68]|nr:YolD-like protein [Alicyclobacillus hesperidum URH17-3-68]
MVLMGYVSVCGRELRVQTGNGVRIVDVRDVVEMEIVSGDSI